MTVEQLIAELSNVDPKTKVYFVREEDSKSLEIECAYAVRSISDDDKNGLAFFLEASK